MRARRVVLLGGLLMWLAGTASAGTVRHMRKRGLPGAKVMAAAAMRSPPQAMRASDGTPWTITHSVATEGLRFDATAEADGKGVVVQEFRGDAAIRTYRFKRVSSAVRPTEKQPYPAGVELVEVERLDGSGQSHVASAQDGSLRDYLRRLPRTQRTTRVALATRSSTEKVDQLSVAMAERAADEGAAIAAEVNGVWLIAEPGASAASVRAQYDAYWSSPQKKAALARSIARAGRQRAAALAKAERAIARLARTPPRTGRALLDAIERDAAAAGATPSMHAIQTLRHPAEIRELVAHLRATEPDADRNIGLLLSVGMVADGTEGHWEAALAAAP